jgi:uncharacterized membrane protein YhfC
MELAEAAPLVFDLGVALGLLASGLVALLLPLALGFWLWRKHGASWRAWLIGAGTFVVAQLVLRLPWQIPLGLWLKPKLGDPAWLYGWLALSAFTAGLFEETGRWAAYRWAWKDRGVKGAVMMGVGHGGIEAQLLVGLSLIGNLVLYLMLTHGVAPTLPPEADQAVRQQFGALTPGLALLAGVERVLALGLHVTCSVLVLRAMREGARWLLGAMALHATANLVAVVVTQQAGAAWGELALLAIIAPALAWTWTQWRRASADHSASS